MSIIAAAGQPAAAIAVAQQERTPKMDVIVELAKSAVTLIGLFVVLIAVPILFMFIFRIATDLDERMTR